MKQMQAKTEGKAVHNFLTTLLTGLTTVFAWMPAGILLVMPFIGLYTGFVYLPEMSLFRLIMLFITSIAGIAGFIGLTSICWNFKLKPKVTFYCLISGTLTIVSVIGIGSLTGMYISLSVANVYLFICPLLFLIVHSVLAYKRLP